MKKNLLCFLAVVAISLIVCVFTLKREKGVSVEELLPDHYPEVYNIQPLPYLEHGWYGNAGSIKKLIESKKVKNVVEVGSWLGNSTRHIASLLPEDGKVIAVDHWLGSSEHFKLEECLPILPTLYQQFLSNVIHEKLTHKILPYRAESVAAAAALKKATITIDLVYLDGAHETESVYADLNAWYPYVKDRGILCGDDWKWSTVSPAIKRFAKENRMRIYTEENFWYLKERKRSSLSKFFNRWSARR